MLFDVLCQGLWLELRATYDPPSLRAFECMLSACVTQPKGLEPCLRVLQDMRQCGLDLDRHYYRPLMDLLGYDALQMQRVLEPFRQHVGFLEVDDEALAALLFAACRTGLSLEQAAARLNGIGVGLPAMTMIYLRLDQPRSAMIMGKSIETRRQGLGKGSVYSSHLDHMYMAERKSVLANYELRQTMGELGWLALDSEYDQPGVINARCARLCATLRESGCVFTVHA